MRVSAGLAALDTRDTSDGVRHLEVNQRSTESWPMKRGMFSTQAENIQHRLNYCIDKEIPDPSIVGIHKNIR